MHTESIDMLLRADRAIVYFRLAVGCAILGLAAWGHHVGLL